MNVPEYLEVNTKNFLKNHLELENQKRMLENDLNVYSETIKKILNVQPITINGKFYISFEDVILICTNEFKKLSLKK